MGKLLRFLGRLLFAALLFSSTYQKLLTPENSKAEFTRGYAKLNNCFNSYGLNYLPSEGEFSTKVILAIKFVGLLEALIASFILIGEHTGGLMSLLYFIVYGALTFTVKDFTEINTRSFAQSEKIVGWVALLGGSLLLASKRYMHADK